jgi:hypothetical protein
MELPLAAYALPDMLMVTKTNGKFADRYTSVSVFEVTGGRNNFSAFVYMCRLNLDLDGSATTYGYDNAANPIQAHLSPLETWTRQRRPNKLLQRQGNPLLTLARRKSGSAMLAAIRATAPRGGRTSSMALATSIGPASKL